MTTKIEVEDQSTKQSEFDDRIRGLAQISQEPPITPEIATALPASILVMSITNFPAMAQEVGTAIQMSVNAGNEKLTTVLKKSMEVMNTSYLSCSEELDARLPARATLAEVGLAEEETN